MDIIQKKIVQAQRNNDNGRTTIKSRTKEVSSRYSTPKKTRAINLSPVPVTKRPLAPVSPPATPVTDASIPEINLGSRKLAGSRLHDSIWPSRMRSLSVSFQSDTFSVPVRRIEKHVTNPLTDRALKPSVNVSQRESTNFLRKPTPERKRSPFDKQSTNTENSKQSRNVSDPPRKSKNLSVSEVSGKVELEAYLPVIQCQSPRQSLPCDDQIRPQSAGKPSSLLRGLSRGISPARIRPSSPARQFNGSNSVLSFIADIKKGTKVANHIEDVHKLRLLYNGHLQWLYTNAESDYTSYRCKIQAERTLYSAWRTTSELRESVIEKRIELQQLKLKLQLYSILNKQMEYLNGWGLLETGHVSALSGSIKDLKASTLHLPVTGGATVHIETVKSAISSAAEVMQTFGSTLESVLSTVEGMNYLVSELAGVAAQERALLDEYEFLLAATEAMQVMENSLKIHLLGLQEQIMSS